MKAMEITINGSSHQLAEATTVQQLLQQLTLGEGRIAVELNGEIVPRSQFSARHIQAGDRLEIVQAIGGG